MSPYTKKALPENSNEEENNEKSKILKTINIVQKDNKEYITLKKIAGAFKKTEKGIEIKKPLYKWETQTDTTIEKIRKNPIYKLIWAKSEIINLKKELENCLEELLKKTPEELDVKKTHFITLFEEEIENTRTIIIVISKGENKKEANKKAQELIQNPNSKNKAKTLTTLTKKEIKIILSCLGKKYF